MWLSHWQNELNRPLIWLRLWLTHATLTPTQCADSSWASTPQFEHGKQLSVCPWAISTRTTTAAATTYVSSLLSSFLSISFGALRHISPLPFSDSDFNRMLISTAGFQSSGSSFFISACTTSSPTQSHSALYEGSYFSFLCLCSVLPSVSCQKKRDTSVLEKKHFKVIVTANVPVLHRIQVDFWQKRHECDQLSVVLLNLNILQMSETENEIQYYAHLQLIVELKTSLRDAKEEAVRLKEETNQQMEEANAQWDEDRRKMAHNADQNRKVSITSHYRDIYGTIRGDYWQ